MAVESGADSLCTCLEAHGANMPSRAHMCTKSGRTQMGRHGSSDARPLLYMRREAAAACNNLALLLRCVCALLLVVVLLLVAVVVVLVVLRHGRNCTASIGQLSKSVAFRRCRKYSSGMLVVLLQGQLPCCFNTTDRASSSVRPESSTVTHTRLYG